MFALRVALFILCATLIAAILHDAFEVMLLPRRVKHKMRIVRYFFDATWALWSAIGRRIKNEARRGNFLALYGPLSLVLMLMVWAAGLIVGFSGTFTALANPELSLHSWLKQAYFSGVTFFTLGYGDVVPHSPAAKLISVMEAGTGLGFIALVIGYLPVIYQLFSRRESHVLTLDAIAGSPPCAVTLLTRFAEGASVERLEGFLLQWQQWCAELLESQLSYPMLAYYRSQHDNQSWLAALTVIIDSCVLVMVGLGSLPTLQARLTFATARLAIVEMGRVLGLNPQNLSEERLPGSVFSEMQEMLDDAGIPFTEEDAESRLAAFRATYERFLNGLAQHLLLPLPGWMADPGQLDNWVNTPRGRSAKRLSEAVEVKASEDEDEH